MSQKRRTFTTEFKKQVVALYKNGKNRQDIVREYDLTASTLDRWIKQFRQSGSFKEQDDRTAEEQELVQLRKKTKQLEIEVIEKNRHIYSVSATVFMYQVIAGTMCEVLQIARSTFYYKTEIAAQIEEEKAAEEQKLKDEIRSIFNKNRQAYGT